MILLSLEDREDVSLCGGRKRVRDRGHLSERLVAGLVQTSKQRETGSTYSRDETWVRVDAWIYVHRHNRRAFSFGDNEVWRGDGIKP